MPPAAAERTHTAPIDGAMTFDSPFPAIDGRLGLGISLLPACGQGRALLMAFQGCAFPCFASETGFALPSPLPGFPAGVFCKKSACTAGARVKLPPTAYAPGMELIAARQGGDLSAQRARARPPCAHAGGLRPPSVPLSGRQTTGAPAARRRGRAHTARQAERARPEAGRQAAETAGMQGRAPRAQPTAPQARGTRARPPSPAIISARVFAACGEHDGGKGGAPLDGRGGGRGASPREMNSPALPHATAGAAAIGQASGRRRAAAAPEGRTGHAPARHADARESAASGQAAQTDGAEAASRRGSRHTSTPRPSSGATTPADGGAAARRAATAQAGRH